MPNSRYFPDVSYTQGCGRNTFGFACCPDLVLLAQGPSLEGCGCQNIAHGCCQDKRTLPSWTAIRSLMHNTVAEHSRVPPVSSQLAQQLFVGLSC